MLDAESAGKPPTTDFQRTDQQHDAQGEFGVLGQSGEERDVRLDERVDQSGQQAVLRPGTSVDERLEVADEVGIGKLVETGQRELDAEGGLDQRRCGERGIATGWEAAGRNVWW